MYTPVNKIYRNELQGDSSKLTGANGCYLADNRPSSAIQRKHAGAIAGGKPMQLKTNDTGLPDQLKSGIENISGYAMDDVKIYYNSDKPAQLSAHAYAQGTDIHLAPGQEKHLPHEAWHVVQQKQGRVRPTTQMKGKISINDNAGLEKEADVMGTRANANKDRTVGYQNLNQAKTSGFGTVQRALGMEFQTYKSDTKLQVKTNEQSEIQQQQWVDDGEDIEERYATGPGVKIEKDGADLEFVTNAFSESDSGRESLIKAMRTIVTSALNLENRTTSTDDLFRSAPGLSKSDGAQPNKRLKSTGPMQAQAQATVGVELDKLTDLLGALRSAGERESTDDLGKIFLREQGRPKGRQGIKPERYYRFLANELGKNVGKSIKTTDVNKTQETIADFTYPQAHKFAENIGDGYSATMKGFLELLGLYMYGGHTKASYAKARTPIVSRTNLADVFMKLPEKDQIMFGKKILAQCEDYFKLAHYPIVELDKPIYKTYPTGEGIANEDITAERVASKTVRRWLESLIPVAGKTGVDILSDMEGLGVIANRNKKANPDPTNYREKWFSNEYGNDVQMQESTDIGPRQSTSIKNMHMSPHRLNGIILELRNLGHDNMDLSEWATFAVSVFDLIVLVNSKDFNEVMALSKAMKEQRSFASDLGDVKTPGIFKGAKELEDRVKKMLISQALSQGVSQHALTDALLNWHTYIKDLD